METSPEYIWYIFIKDLEVSWQKSFLRKVVRIHLGRTVNGKLSKWVEGRIIFYLNETFLHLGRPIKQVSVNKICN